MIEPGSDLFACAQIVERGDPARFASVMAAPLGARAVLFPIYAFNIEVARAPWVTAEPMIAEMRLQWWRDALEEIADRGVVRRHEVVVPLAAVLDAEGARRLDRLVAARRLDLERAPFDDAAAFWAYLEDTGGGLMAVAARALGDADGRAAAGLGAVTGLAAYLLAVPDLEARGRAPLWDSGAEEIAGLAQEGLARLAAARRAWRAVPRRARPALVPAIMAEPVLRRVADDPGSVARGTALPAEAGLRWRRLWAGVTGRV